MDFVYSDGGRSKYFETKNVNDCVTRAVCNATNQDYKVVYNTINQLEKSLKLGKHEKQGSSRSGVRKKVTDYYLEKYLGLKRLNIGKTASLTEEYFKTLPQGTYIVAIAKHVTCVKNNKLLDTYDCSIKKYHDISGNVVINDRRHIYKIWRFE